MNKLTPQKKLMAAALFGMVLSAPLYSQATGIPTTDWMKIFQDTVYYVQQINEEINQLNQMKAQVQAVTGNRGYGNYMTNQQSYVPNNFYPMLRALDGSSSSYGEFANAVLTIKQNQAVLTDAQMNNLPVKMRSMIQQNRDLTWTMQAMGQDAYSKSGQRVQILKQLTNAINGTTDQKAIAELSARIQSEQNMLANDQSRLIMIKNMQDAQDRAMDVRYQEMRVETSGSGNYPTIDPSIEE